MNDEFFMDRALELARQADGWTSPNPLVGAVVVRDGRIVGEGYHMKAGTPHAEVHALKMAGSKARGAALYVTLEPCCHHGRTPPCTDAVLKAGITRVVAAMEDPNPVVAGKGLRKLQAAGVEVKTGVLEQESRQLNEVFLKYIVSHEPFIAVKSAVTLDGKIATKTGSSQWITGSEARIMAHRLRHRYDAVLAGIGTVLADDPLLTVRVPGEKLKNPVRVIIDSQLKIPFNAQVLDTGQAPTIIYTAGVNSYKLEVLEDKGVEVVACPGEEGRVDLAAVFRDLGKKGITGVLVEGGGEIHGSIFDRHLADKIYIFMAPKIVGSHRAPGMIGGSGISRMGEAVKIYRRTIEQVGEDLLITGYPCFKEE